MKKLTKKQKFALITVALYGGLPTNRLSKLAGNFQTYDTVFRDRLFVLAAKGYVRFEEERGPRGGVKARRWYVVEGAKWE